jgi:hypothetical protein
LRLAVIAGALWLIFALVSLLGLRESVTVLSLTAPAGKSFEQGVAEMAIYLLTYFGATLAAPIFAIAALLRFGFDRVAPPKPSAGRESRTRLAAGP